MLYRNINILTKSKYNLAINFMVYRVVRILFDLNVVSVNELVKHEDLIYTNTPVGLHIDFEHYRMYCNEVDYEQF